MKAYAVGNEIVWNVEVRRWFIKATGEQLTDKTVQDLVCPKCGKCPTPEGHDPCIANLPGVDFACCGHGVKRGYVKFTNGLLLRGEFDHVQSIGSIFNKESNDV